MNEILQNHLSSAFKAFVSAFCASVALTLQQTGSVQWTTAFFYSILVTALNAGAKETLPTVLGGRKKE